MIAATELRIGNKFLSAFNRIETVMTIIDNTDNGKCEYVSEHHKLMYSHLIIPYECGNQYKPCEISGIPLTPEIMMKAGFEEKNSNEYWRHFVLKTGWYISQWVHDLQMAGFEKKGVFYWSDDYIEIKYLHDLQNLYHGLYHKELEITL